MQKTPFNANTASLLTTDKQQIRDISNNGTRVILVTRFSVGVLTRHISSIYTEKPKNIDTWT